MALSTRKKNMIIADWKAGRFKNFSEVAKRYKIDYKTAKKILVGISQTNAEIVEAGVKYEMAQKSIKNPVEKMAVEIAVKEKTATEKMRETALDNTLKISVYTSTASVKNLQKKMASNKEIEPSELIEHQRVAKMIVDTVNKKENKVEVQNDIQVQQLALSQQEQTQTKVEVTQLDPNSLVEVLKQRGLPLG